MHIYNISKKEIRNLKRVGSGEEAIVYEFNNNQLLKLYHSYKKISAGKIIMLSSMQHKIKNTKLPLGPVYDQYDIIGCMHYYHKNAINFDDLIDIEDQTYKIDKFRQLNNNIDELLTNNIYFYDLDNQNVLITPNHKVELIDTDSANISNDKGNKLSIYRQLKSMILETLFNQEYYLNDEEILSGYDVNYKYIDDFTANNLSPELFNEFFDYLEKDKVLIKKREV